MQELAHKVEKGRYEQIKHDFVWASEPTEDHSKIVLRNAGFGYAHYAVRIVDMPKQFVHKYSSRDLAIAASKGWMPFGWTVDGPYIKIYTD